MAEIIKPKEREFLWEILVPTKLWKVNGDNHEHVIISQEYHNQWDEEVLKITGSDGLTRPPVTSGQWENPNGKLFKEQMLPIRFVATEKAALQVAKFTKKYYNQEKIMCYLLSDKVFFI